MPGGKVTTDHDEIREFVERRGGHPARVVRTGAGDDPGLLRIDYPGYGGARSLEPISWDEFFDKFDESRLALVYQDEPDSRFTKLVSRDNPKPKVASRRASGARGGSRTGAGSRPAASSRRRAASSGGRASARRGAGSRRGAGRRA